MNKYLITNLDSTALSFPRILASYNVYLARSDLPSSTAPQKPVNVSTRKKEIISNNAAAPVYGVVKMILPNPLFIRVTQYLSYCFPPEHVLWG